MSAVGSEIGAARAVPQIRYLALPPDAPPPSDALCTIGFGTAPRAGEDARHIHVGLRVLRGAGLCEIWRGGGPVRTGNDGEVRHACDGEFLAGILELDEHDHGGMARTAQHAYETLCRFHAASPYPHLLRIWNYFGGINDGDGDAERYRQFCSGRAAGFAHYPGVRWPAATAIGRPGGGMLQVYWLAGRAPGQPLENPRQVEAWRYPRRYGPAPPYFSRAMLVAGELLLVSGTASIVGHASHHPGDLEAQVLETLDNLASVGTRGHSLSPRVPQALTSGSVLKVYLREAAAAGALEALLRARLPPGVQYLILEADTCRRELLVEIDCVHGPG